MTRRPLDIFTSPPAFIAFVIVLLSLWAAGLLGPALLFAWLSQPAIVVPEGSR